MGKHSFSIIIINDRKKSSEILDKKTYVKKRLYALKSKFDHLWLFYEH
jgi:hypothetical protein